MWVCVFGCSCHVSGEHEVSTIKTILVFVDQWDSNDVHELLMRNCACVVDYVYRRVLLGSITCT